jgi:hypothetical protein
MYQPRMRDELITKLYHEAKRRHMKMTQLLHNIVESRLKALEAETVPMPHIIEPVKEKSVKRIAGRRSNKR